MVGPISSPKMSTKTQRWFSPFSEKFGKPNTFGECPAASQPAIQPARQPGSQPASQAASQPASHPASQAGSQPASHPRDGLDNMWVCICTNALFKV